jgi:hypothetical protein
MKTFCAISLALLFTDVSADTAPYHAAPYCNFDTGQK